MRGVLVAAVLIVLVMIAIKDGRVLREAGLTGGCRAVATPKGQDGDWQACVPGKLQGAPDLRRQSCTSAGFNGSTEYWRCPAGIDGGPG
jgi:hypothetical protein